MTVSLRTILAATLAVVLAHVAIAGESHDDPKFEKFKREMLPQVGRKVTVVGKIDSGKLGWWLSSQDWGLYLYTTTTNSADFAKMNGLNKFSGNRVRVVGTLRHRGFRDSGNPLVPSIPEHFFFDVAEIVVSDDEISAPGNNLVGSWTQKNGIITCNEDGTFESFFTNRTAIWEYQGTWLTKGNVLVLTQLKSNGVPNYDVSNFKINRADGNRLIYSIDGQTMTFIRKPTESKPSHFAALEKAKKLRISTVKFDGLPLSLVITMLHDECVRSDPARKGVTISLGPDAKQLADAEIKVELRDVTLAETLWRVADTVGLEVQGNDTEILLVRKKAK